MQKLQVWWIPQVGYCPRFTVSVNSLEQAKLLLDTLAAYDIFQLVNNIKPDFANAGGLELWNEEDESWEDWYDEDTGMDFDEYCREGLDKVVLEELCVHTNLSEIRLDGRRYCLNCGEPFIGKYE